MAKIKITRLICKRCNHEWVPKKEEVRQCPKCKSAWWDEDREEESEDEKTKKRYSK